MDPITIISLASSIIPTAAKWLGLGDDKADKVKKVADTIDGVARAISGKDDTKEALETIRANPEMAAKMQSQWQQFELGIQQELTARHEADMKSDSKLAKNIRPLTMLGLVSTVVGMCWLNGTDISWEGQKVLEWTFDHAMYTDLVELCKYTFGYYFIGRSTEKFGGVKLPFIGK